MEKTTNTSSKISVNILSFNKYFEEAKKIYKGNKFLSDSKHSQNSNKEGIPKPQLRKLCNFLQMIVENPDLLEQNPQLKPFLYGKLAKGLVPTLCNTSTESREYFNNVCSILKHITLLLANEPQNKDLVNSVKNIFRHTVQVYHSRFSKPKLVYDKWRYKLKVGDRLECIKAADRWRCWGVAIITFIYGNTLELQFQNDSEIHDKSVSRFSPDLARYGTHSKEYDWKHELKAGDKIDCFDKISVCYSSTILKSKVYMSSNGRAWPILKIAFRVYSPTGKEKDHEGNHYDGWDYRHDEWIPLYSPRIYKYNSTTWKSDYFNLVGHNICISDSYDPKIKENDNQIYAVMRPTISACPFHIECLNLFGSQGGYDKILDFLNDANSIDSDLLEDLIILSGNAFLLYHRDFVKKFALEIKNSVKKLIFKMTNIDPKYIATKFKSVIKPLANLLKRVNPIEQVKDEIETLQLKFIINLVQSNNQDLKHQGMMMLSNIFDEINQKLTYISSRDMYQWLNENQILDLIVNSNNQIKTIKSSLKIMGFYLDHSFFTEQDIDLFWMTTKLDQEIKQEFFEIILQKSKEMNYADKTKILQRLLEDSIDEIDYEIIDFVYKMGNSESSSQENILIACQILFKFIVTDSIDSFCCDRAFNLLHKLLKTLNCSYVNPLLKDCLNNLKNDLADVESICIMRLLMKKIYTSEESKENSYMEPGKSINFDHEETLENVQNIDESKDANNPIDRINSFIENENLIDVLLTNLTNYTQTVHSLLEYADAKVPIKDQVFIGKYDHQTHIKTSLEFFAFLSSVSSYKIGFKELHSIHKLLFEESQIEYNNKAVLHWVKDLYELQNSGVKIVNIKDENVKQFLNEKSGG